MLLRLKPQEFEIVRDFINEASAIAVADNKAYLIENRLSDLAIEYGCASFAELCLKAKNDRCGVIRERMVDLMTTNETLWFRDSHPFLMFKEKMLPEYAAQVAAGKRRKIRIWSAASSTGQEPYSLAILILEALRQLPALKAEMFEILATDISPSSLLQAQEGRYDRVAIGRGLNPEYRQRYFKDEGRFWAIAPEVKKLVKFQKFNLRDSCGGFGSFDIILCRNVAIYFSKEFKSQLFARFARALNPDGIFFLGASESVIGYCNDFEMLQYLKGFYYGLRNGKSNTV